MEISRTSMRNTESLIYDIFVRTTKRGVEIYTIDYDEKLKVFSPAGKETSSRKWTSKVRTVAIGDIDADGYDDIVAGTKDCVIVIGNKGQVIYQIAKSSPVITCDAADVDGDYADEFAAAMRDNTVSLWNDDMKLFTRSFPSPVVSVRLENITDDPEYEIVVMERSGNISILSAAGYLLKQFTVPSKIRVGTVLNLENDKLFATGDKSNNLKIWDMGGRLVQELKLSDRPFALDADRHPRSDSLYLAIGTRLPALEIYRVKGDTMSSLTRRVIDEISSTKETVYRRAIRCGHCGAPVSPETPSCANCGAILDALQPQQIDEFISETILSVTSLNPRIALRELDRVIRRSLPRPAVYNLRSQLQEMVRCELISGHFEDDGRTFVFTGLRGALVTPSMSRRDARKLLSRVVSGNKIELGELLDMKAALQDPDVDHELDAATIRRALILLRGKGQISGEFIDTKSFAFESKEELDRVVDEIIELLSAQGS